MTRLVLELDDDTHQAIKVKAAQANRTIKDMVTELLKKWIKQK